MNKRRHFSIFLMIFLFGCFKPPEEKTVSIKRFSFIDSKIFDGHRDPKLLTISRDGKNIYVAFNDGKELYHAEVLADKKNLDFKPLPLTTNLSNGPGKASIKNAYKVVAISSANDGALISIYGLAPAGAPPGTLQDNGAIYFSGKAPKAAWISRPEDLDTGPGKILTDDLIHAFLVQDQEGKDVPYFWKYNPGTELIEIAKTKKDLAPALADALVGRAGGGTLSPLMESGGDFIFAAISRKETPNPLPPPNPRWVIAPGVGVTAILRMNAGIAADFPDISRGDAPSAKGVVGVQNFQMRPGYSNDKIQALRFFKGDLYIGLGIGKTINGTPSDFNGGVAVFHLNLPSISPPDRLWEQKAVKGFMVGDDVFAICDHEILKAYPDGKRGGSFFEGLPLVDENYETAKDGYVKESFPTLQNFVIDSAVLVNGELLLATDSGLLAVKKIEKKVITKHQSPYK